MRSGFWWGDLEEGDFLEYLGVDGRTILKYMLKKQNGSTSTEFFWLRIEISGCLL
jgi:hypothetical protein